MCSSSGQIARTTILTNPTVGHMEEPLKQGCKKFQIFGQQQSFPQKRAVPPFWGTL